MSNRFGGWQKKAKTEGNQKVKGARKIEAHGIKFDSKLELFCYDQLTAAGIPFEFQKTYVLQPNMRYPHDKVMVRSIEMRVDFWLPQRNMLIDTKGFQLADNKIKWKMLKFIFLREHVSGSGALCPQIFLPRTQKEVIALVTKIQMNAL